jgi:plastocyanin
MISKTLLSVAAVAVASLLLAAPAGSAPSGKPQKKTVEMLDNYYSPSAMTVNYGSTITWEWPSGITDEHDVNAGSVPKGAKKFHSPSTYTAGATYKQTFTAPGVYKLYCSFHETDMTMTVTVKKKPRR